MARRGKDQAEVQALVTKESRAFLEGVIAARKAEGQTVNIADLVRESMADHFEKDVEFFMPRKWGEREDMATEREMVGLVLERIEALGLPTPKQDYRIRQHAYDLAWPEQKAAIEIRLKWRESEPGWIIIHIAPGMSKAAIDHELKELFEKE